MYESHRRQPGVVGTLDLSLLPLGEDGSGLVSCTHGTDIIGPMCPRAVNKLTKLLIHQAETLQVGEVLSIKDSVMCGMSPSGPTFAAFTAARNTSVGAIAPRTGRSGLR